MNVTEPVAAWTMSAIFATDNARVEYVRDLDILWRFSVVEANANFNLASAVRETPIKFLFGIQPQAYLLGRIGENALRLAALDTVNALTDKTHGSLTTEYLRQRVLELCCPEVKQALSDHLEVEFAARDLPELRKRAIRMRHKIFAHFDAAHFRNPQRFANSRVTRAEIGQLLEFAKGLVAVLSFEVGRSFEFIPPLKNYEMPDLILDLVRRHSRVLDMPEKDNPHVFHAVWEHWNAKERGIFNEWRERTGRKPVTSP